MRPGRYFGPIDISNGLIETVENTASTNADLLERAEKGAGEGLWLRAEQQSGGHGRLGRVWESPRGNLYCSTILRLKADDPPAFTLSFVAGLAALKTANDLLPNANARLKWPNDVLVDGAKLSGILLERRGDAVVIGIGMNVRIAPDVPGRAVTSLLAQGAHIALGPADVLEPLVTQFAAQVQIWRSDGVGAILADWEANAHIPGEYLTVKIHHHESLTGQYNGLQADGALRLKLLDGTIKIITTGDVDILR